MINTIIHEREAFSYPVLSQWNIRVNNPWAEVKFQPQSKLNAVEFIKDITTVSIWDKRNNHPFTYSFRNTFVYSHFNVIATIYLIKSPPPICTAVWKANKSPSATWKEHHLRTFHALWFHAWVAWTWELFWNPVFTAGSVQIMSLGCDSAKYCDLGSFRGMVVKVLHLWFNMTCAPPCTMSHQTTPMLANQKVSQVLTQRSFPTTCWT